MGKPQVAIVDDEHDIIDSYKDFLESKYDVTSFINADKYLSFIAKHEKNPFELVITDFSMGDIDGLEMIQRSKQMNKSCPFILISGFLNTNNSILAHDYGAYKILTKPIDPNNLELQVQNLIYQNQINKIRDENKGLTLKLKELCSIFDVFLGQFASEKQIEEFFNKMYRTDDNTKTMHFREYLKNIDDHVYRNTKMEDILARQIKKL